MPTYRVYRLDGAGRILSADWIEASAEEPAIQEAHTRCPAGGFELWRGQRLVHRAPLSDRPQP